MQNSVMNIRFEGDSHQIDANTLVNYIIHYRNAVEVANSILGKGTKNVSVKINAVNKGSFLMQFEIVETMLQSLFSSDGLAYVANLCTVIGAVYGAYRIHKGKASESEDRLKDVAEKYGADARDVYDVYSSPMIREAIGKSFETLEQDGSVEGLEVGVGECLEEFPRDDFPDLKDGWREVEESSSRVVETECDMTVLSLGFEPGSRWTFMFNGARISMNVKDDALMKQIDAGERFGKGDRIRVKLRVVQTFFPEIQAFKDTSFRIVEFYEHVPAARQTELFEKEDG